MPFFVLKLSRLILPALIFWLVVFKLDLGPIAAFFDRLDLVEVFGPVPPWGFSTDVPVMIDGLQRMLALFEVDAVDGALDRLDVIDLSRLPLVDGLRAGLDRVALIDRLSELPQTAVVFFTWTLFCLWYLIRP